jgi:hypothetical protein
MPAQFPYVSVIEPLAPAFERVKQILFRPFDLGRWLVIGLAAWLAQLGQGTRGGVGYRFQGDAGARGIMDGIAAARDYFLNNMHWLIPSVIGLVILVLAIWLVLTWLSSRGQFMFLHCVTTNRAEAAIPWTRFAAHGNSLFLFRAGLGLLAFFLILPFMLIGLFNIVDWGAGDGRVALSVFRLVLISSSIAVIAVAYVLVRKLTLDFVVPIMALETESCLAGWRRFISLLSENKVSFLLYVLFSIVIALAIGAIILALIIVTCCCAGCLMAIPYVGTVLILPIHVFRRSYSLIYLAQYGPGLDLFAGENAQVAQS